MTRLRDINEDVDISVDTGSETPRLLRAMSVANVWWEAAGIFKLTEEDCLYDVRDVRCGSRIYILG